MIIPVRCISCGKPIGQLFDEYESRVKRGEDRKKVMDSLGLQRYCCRSVFLGHVDLLEVASKFKKY